MLRGFALLVFGFLLHMPGAYAKSATCESNLRPKTLQEIYGLPLQELEDCMAPFLADICSFEIEPGGKADDPKINSVEICAVHYYTVSSFVDINRRLWKTDSKGRGLKGNDWAYVRIFDHALSKIKPEKPLTVYRGTRRTLLKFSQPGQIVRLRGYTSTSPDVEVAKWFLNGEGDDHRVMVIQTHSARDISGYAGAPEKEYLLPRSTHVRFERSEIKELSVYNEETQAEQKIKVEFVYLTEVDTP